MSRAVIAGLCTVLGTFLGAWGVFQQPRLDWPEFALLIGAGLFVAGATMIWEAVKTLDTDDAE